MFYYWLIPVLVVAIVAVLFFAYGAKRKGAASNLDEGDSPEAIKRGRYLNK